MSLGTKRQSDLLKSGRERRGKIGYLIGGYMERGEAGMISHYRRPHLQIYHTGKGRTIPRLVNVRGCIVHREIVAKIPTGYERDEE